MTLLQLLNSEGYICCHKVVLKTLGVYEALVLGKLCSVAQMVGYEGFYITMDRICEDIGLSQYHVRRAINSLKDFGFLSMSKKGVPCRNHYIIHRDRLSDILGGGILLEQNNTEVM